MPLTHAHMRASLAIFQEHESLVLAHSRGSITIGHEGEVSSNWAAPEDTVVNVLIHDAQGQYVTRSSSSSAIATTYASTPLAYLTACGRVCALAAFTAPLLDPPTPQASFICSGNRRRPPQCVRCKC